MKKYRIKWDYGYGEEEEVIEAETLEAAENEAYENWLEGAEGQAHYEAEELEDEES